MTMTAWGRRLFVLSFAASIVGVAGCFAGSSNPSYFPHWVPFGQVLQPHARPVGPSYYENFDPKAVDVNVEPIGGSTSQVGSQVVILATVRDEKGVPRRNRMVEWAVTGGNIVQVDESGIHHGRGGIVGHRAWSFTNYHEHRLQRGNANQADDVMLRPGQSWCVVSSPVEGDTHIQVVVPGIHNWDKRMKTVIIRWVDAVWEFPGRAVKKFGTEHEFVTKVAKFTSREPLAQYRVRYKIVGGPPAVLLPSQAQEEIAVTDLNGLGKVRIRQLAPTSGTNRISVELIRPPDPSTPTGSGVSIVKGETEIEWLAPNVTLNHQGPAIAAVGANVTYTTTAKNDGRIDSQWVEFTLPVPDGLEFVSSNPPAEPQQGRLVFPFPTLGVGQQHVVQTTFRTRNAGPIKSVVLMRTAEGQNDQREFNTLVTMPGLKAEIIAPKTGLINVPINYAIRLSNPGTGDLDEIQIVAEYDVGLEFPQAFNLPDAQKRNILEKKIAGLKAGETRDEPLVLTPSREGPLGLRVTASGAGLKQQAVAIVNVQKPKVSLRVEGPNRRYVGRPVEWKIFVKNDGESDQTGVVVRDRLPSEVRFVAATRNGTHAAGEVTWNLGAIRAGEEVVLELTGECLKATLAAEKTTLASADGGVRVEQTSRLQIDGIAALKMELKDRNDPVEVGKTVIYEMTLTNTGSAPANKIDVKATVPDLMKAIRASGPTKEAIAGKFINFGRVENLQPGQKITFLFECQALKEGDVRFRVEFSSELNPTPIFEEEPTHIVAPFSNPLPGPAPPPLPAPPPGGGAPLPKG
ncbi:MAG: DUF11 domain-containing protein [Gemmataceae bacterium]|nr:DUF11 domain-containing protein [Gemmataceae bacterium]